MPTELNPNVHMRSLVGDMSNAIDEAILAAIESNANDQLLASLAEARGGIVRMNYALSVVTFYTRETDPLASSNARPLKQPIALDALPPLQKQPKSKDTKRPGISRLRKSPITYTCPSCQAEPGTPCFYMSGPGNDSKPTEERRTDGWMHGKRCKLAADHNRRVKEKYDREHFEAKA